MVNGGSKSRMSLSGFCGCLKRLKKPSRVPKESENPQRKTKGLLSRAQKSCTSARGEESSENEARKKEHIQSVLG